MTHSELLIPENANDIEAEDEHAAQCTECDCLCVFCDCDLDEGCDDCGCNAVREAPAGNANSAVNHYPGKDYFAE